ncbi:MAG TPA: sigma-54 dependent transcriptional regulator [Candidatus Bathyarchaeia archaeon]|nr:sigma-54 dependent transcriptional regulator [Candidatus Bathyarchaeia archaeon]
MSKTLIIDDNRELAQILSAELARRGHTVHCAHTGKDGLALLDRMPADLIFLDLRLPDMDGTQILEPARTIRPDAQVVIMTAYPQLSSALAAIRSRVVDYLCKPFTFEELTPVLQRAILGRARSIDAAPPRERGDARRDIEMVGVSEASKALRAMIAQLAASGVRAALVTGESGTGKELAAGLLHLDGPRRDGPFIEVNCSAITESLFESELFGHERGAFTGAVTARRGLAEMADGGTLFLDEIGEMPLGCQAKLLRFLDDQTFLRVGGSRKIWVNVQIVAATNRDLKAMVDAGAFRADLYYRLLVAPVALSPLRSRPDDILPLAAYWLGRISAQHGHRVKGFTPEAEQRLLSYPWPGNVREMRNLIERLVILCPGDRIDVDQLPLEFRPPGPARGPDATFLYRLEQARRGGDPRDEEAAGDIQAPSSLHEIGHAHIRMVLAKMNGNKTKAAQALGISRQTLRSRLASLP